MIKNFGIENFISGQEPILVWWVKEIRSIPAQTPQTHMWRAALTLVVIAFMMNCLGSN